MTEGQAAGPANVLNIVAINQGRLALTRVDPRPQALDAARFAALRRKGCLVVDARSSVLFGGGHIPGSYNIGAGSPEFEQRIGWVTPPDIPLLLVVGADEQADEAARRMAFIGLDQRLEGYLAGGVQAWVSADEPIVTLTQTSVHELSADLGGGNAIQVLDVREAEEWDQGHIEGAHAMSYKVLREHVDEIGIDRQEPLAVVCARGARSSIACSVLLSHGFEHVRNVAGGMHAWQTADLPMVDLAGNPVTQRGLDQ